MHSPSQDDDTIFNNRIAATAIVNNAVIRCQLAGLPVTIDNVILCVADFFDPTDPRYLGVVGEIERALAVTLGAIRQTMELH